MADLSETLEQIVSEPAAAQADGQSVTAIDPLKVIAVENHLNAKAAVAGTNSAGGPRSAWRGIRAARGVPPGATT